MESSAHQEAGLDTSNSGPSPSSEDRSTDQSKLKALFSALGIGLGWFILSGLFGSLLVVPYFLVSELTPQAEMAFSIAGSLLATLAAGWLYFIYTDRTTDFIDIKKPTPNHYAIVLITIVSLLIVATLVELAGESLGLSLSEHQIYQSATSADGGIDPLFVLFLVPVALVVIGPTEEFIYRNLIQKSLYSSYGTKGAILLTSVLFALPHFPAYLTASIGEATVSLLVVFSLSIILGTIYAKTESLVVASLAHGGYNAVLFLFLYLEIIGITFSL